MTHRLWLAPLLMVATAGAVYGAPHMVHGNGTEKKLPSRSLTRDNKRVDSGNVAARVSRKLTLMEASGQVTSTVALKTRERLREISRERAALKEKHKHLTAQDERRLSEQLLTLDNTLESNRKRSRGLASKLFNWF